MKPGKMFENVWIHIAGNPTAITYADKKPNLPHWRFRIGQNGQEYTMKTWQVTGVFDETNNTQGIQLGAPFLLWYALYGDVTVTSVEHISIVLKSDNQPLRFAFEYGGIKTQTQGNVKIYGAPDLVNAKSTNHWRFALPESDLLESVGLWQVSGEANAQNQGFGEDMMSSNPLQKIWLSFSGDIALDRQGNVNITI